MELASSQNYVDWPGDLTLAWRWPALVKEMIVKTSQSIRNLPGFIRTSYSEPL